MLRDIQKEFVQLRTAALASGKITAKQIIEATNGLDTVETRYSALLKLTEPHNITIPVPESYSDKIANLTEKALASGKLTSVQIIESMSECSNEQERFEALQSLTVAKRIGVPRVERKNGTTVVSEADHKVADNKTRIKAYQKKFKISEKEACLMLGLEYIPESMGDTNDAKLHKRVGKLRSMGFNEADAKKIMEEGWFFGA